MEKNKSDAERALEGAALYSDKGVLRGYALIGPEGQHVLSPRATLHLAASVERGIYVEGLKDGWRLDSAKSVAKPTAAPADVKHDKK